MSSRPVNAEERRRALTRIYLALPQERRDALDSETLFSAQHEARRRGFSPDFDYGVWLSEVNRLRNKIRDRRLTPDEWQREDDAEALKASVAADQARKPSKRGVRKPTGGYKQGGHRPVRGGKDASIERERDGDDPAIPSA